MWTHCSRRSLPYPSPQLRYPGDQPPIGAQRLADYDAVLTHVIQPHVLEVVTAPHLDYRHHLAQLTFQLDVALEDDHVGQERHLMRTEAEIGEALGHFHRHEDGHAG